MVAPEQVAMELLEVVLEVFALLGWSVKNATEHKSPSSMFNVLGVLFDFTESMRKQFVVTNTEERIASLKECIAQLLNDTPDSGPLLTSLHGCLRFARGQCFPRAGALALNTLVAFMFRRLDRL